MKGSCVVRRKTLVDLVYGQIIGELSAFDHFGESALITATQRHFSDKRNVGRGKDPDAKRHGHRKSGGQRESRDNDVDGRGIGKSAARGQSDRREGAHALLRRGARAEGVSERGTTGVAEVSRTSKAERREGKTRTRFRGWSGVRRWCAEMRLLWHP